MKQGGFRFTCLIFMACIAVFSTFGDEKTVVLESIILESFDGDSPYDWRLDASKFASTVGDDVFPQIAKIPEWPRALFGANKEGKELYCLGIWSKFDRTGYNWIDIYPVEKDADEDAEPMEIPIPGRVQIMDIWAWGSGFNYYLEVYLRDYLGVVHSVYVANLAFDGWKNLRIPIPKNIPQTKRYLPRRESLRFVKFRIWTTPREKVDDYMVYFDQFKVLTDTFETLFDGDALTDPDFLQEHWNISN